VSTTWLEGPVSYVVDTRKRAGDNGGSVLPRMLAVGRPGDLRLLFGGAEHAGRWLPDRERA